MKENLAYAANEEQSDTAVDDNTYERLQAEFMLDLKQGLARQRKSISPKYFYDAAGSALFDKICNLPEYYPTRTEAGIFSAHAADMAAFLRPALPGPHALVDLGAGDGAKAALGAFDHLIRSSVAA